MNILDKIHTSADVKALDKKELNGLCEELREELIRDVAKTGGHLASNLGAVELTVALHRVYDSAKDRIVFDVGHQCYTHKLITGRRDRFDSLRQFGGISGFPKPAEAADDACIAGHASTSISTALGMARARTLSGGDYDVCAVIGDGALTGGLAYEGLTNCGESGEPIVVILNDNAMSIAENVGGMARLLAHIRVRPGYIAFKRIYHKIIGRCGALYNVLHKVKEWVKDFFLPDNMFEDMGFYYLGPIDGHDVRTLVRTIRYARDMKVPVLLHVLTVKGKGYAPAEASPAAYHGVGSFDPAQGVSPTESENFSSVFGRELTALAAQDPTIVAVTAAMADGTGLTGFASRYPNRFFDVGIAEAHGVTMSAGMAKQGLKPVFAVYSSFLQRGYDQLIHDVALDGLHVVFGVDRAGLVGSDGETHQGAFDVGYLCQIPGMKVLAPSDYTELRSMLALALNAEGPVALRYSRGKEGSYRGDSTGENVSLLREGFHVTVVSYGVLINEALAAAERLSEKGVNVEVLKLNRLDAPNYERILTSVRKTGAIIVAEDTAAMGCVGTRILAKLTEAGVSPRFARLLNLGSGVVPQGTVDVLWHNCGIDAAAIVGAYEDKTE